MQLSELCNLMDIPKEILVRYEKVIVFENIENEMA